MARTRNPTIVLGPDGKPLAGAKVHTTIRSSGVDANVYAGETGSTPGENPATTDAKGMVVQWLDRGAYNSTITAEGMEPFVDPWDSAPGSDAAIDPVWLEAKLKDGEPGESTTRKLGHGSKEALPGNDPRIANTGLQDILQAGVVAETDWSFTANINSGTGALGSTGATGGVAWLADPATSGALLRSVTTPAALSGLAPGSLPTSGKYRNIGFELTPGEWGAAATVSLKAGTEKSSQAEAEAAPPAVSGGKTKIRNVVIKNTAGVYSIVAQFDMRPWVSVGVGPWIALSFGSKAEAASGQSPAVRTEGGGAIARLRGRVKVKSANELAIGETLATIPVGFRPVSAIEFTTVVGTSTATALIAAISTGGIINFVAGLAELQTVRLDSVTYNLT